MGKNTEWAVSKGVEPGGGVRGWSLGHGQTWTEPEAAGDSKSGGGRTGEEDKQKEGVSWAGEKGEEGVGPGTLRNVTDSKLHTQINGCRQNWM